MRHWRHDPIPAALRRGRRHRSVGTLTRACPAQGAGGGAGPGRRQPPRRTVRAGVLRSDHLLQRSVPSVDARRSGDPRRRGATATTGRASAADRARVRHPDAAARPGWTWVSDGIVCGTSVATSTRLACASRGAVFQRPRGPRLCGARPCSTGCGCRTARTTPNAPGRWRCRRAAQQSRESLHACGITVTGRALDPGRRDTARRGAQVGGIRVRASLTPRCRLTGHPVWRRWTIPSRVNYCPCAPSSRLAQAGRVMSMTPRNGNLFWRAP